MTSKQRWGLGLLIVGFGALVLALLIATQDKPQKSQPKVQGPLVRSVLVQPAQALRWVYGQGVVRPVQSVALQAKVAGQVIWRNPKLRPGASVHAGEALFRLDSDDLAFAVAQQEAAVADAALAVSLEEGQGKSAARDFAALHSDALNRGARPSLGKKASPVASDLALRKPQAAAAKARLVAAKAALDRARRDLDRAIVRAPIDGMVRGPIGGAQGQWIGGQSVLLTVVEDRMAWITVSVPFALLPELGFGADTSSAGGEAVVRMPVDGQETAHEGWPGRVVQVLPDVDPLSRMAQVLIELDRGGAQASVEANPWSDDAIWDSSLKEGDRAVRKPALFGAWVEVALSAGKKQTGFWVPTRSIRPNSNIWLAEAKNSQEPDKESLKIRSVRIGWQRGAQTFVLAGLNEGDKIVLGSIAAPVAGMHIRTVDVLKTSQNTPKAAP